MEREEREAREAGVEEETVAEAEPVRPARQSAQATPPPPRRTYEYEAEPEGKREQKEPGLLESVWEGIKYWLPKK